VRLAASVGAALLVLAGLGCAGAALYGHLGSRVIGTQAAQKGGPLKSMEVALDPAMNPMRITVTAQVDERNRAAFLNRREDYNLWLYRNGQLQKRWMAMLSPEDENRKPRLEASFSVEPVEVAEAGKYVIVLMRPGGDIAPLFTGHVVRVQRIGPRAADVMLAWFGAILIVLGVVLRAVFGLPSRKKIGL
jgi:hypothetical protein